MCRGRGSDAALSKEVTPAKGWVVCHAANEAPVAGKTVSRAAASKTRRFMVEVYDFC